MGLRGANGWRGLVNQAVLASFVLCLVVMAHDPASAIDVKLTVDEAKKALAAGREPMEKALSMKDDKASQEEAKKIAQDASLKTRVGADPEKDSCGASAILRTKRYWFESFGHQEARESKKQKREIRMPEDKIQKSLDMPNLEISVQLCGDDEYFAEGAQVVFQQGAKHIKPVDVSPAERGRKNEGQGPAYRTRFTARFAYDSFDPNAKTKVIVFFLDGKQIEFDADFSKVK